MDTLTDKVFATYGYLSRYANVPYYFDNLVGREVYGIGTNLKTTTEYVTHKLKSSDTLNSLSLKYYNNPTFWWVIAYFNNIQDPFKPLIDKYEIVRIPNIASVAFGRINE